MWHSSATNNNNALFAVQPSVAANGTLTYTPAANANGSAVVVVRLTDNGGSTFGGTSSVDKTFTISVTSVNDAPAFTKGANLTVQANAGAQTVAGWATGLSVGPANEAGQTLSFTVTNSNNALFAVQPTIAANGTLTFTPSTTGSGTATVSVVLKDNGGTANGGVDSSAVQTFTITVNPVASNNRPDGKYRGSKHCRTRPGNCLPRFRQLIPMLVINAAGFTFTINWGDGSAVQTLPAGTLSGAVVNHTFAASRNYTISVTAKDRTGQVSAAVTKVVTVAAVVQQGAVLVVGGTSGNNAVNVFTLNGTRAVVDGAWFGPFAGITSIQV